MAGQGDQWTREYYRRNPWPDICERCGNKATKFRTYASAEKAGLNWREIDKPVAIVWDHCHYHLIVRGALCHDCNAREGNSVGLAFRGEGIEFDEWRKRCHPCNEIYPQVDKWELENSQILRDNIAQRDGMWESLIGSKQGSKKREMLYKKREKLADEYWKLLKEYRAARSEFIQSLNP